MTSDDEKLDDDISALLKKIGGGAGKDKEPLREDAQEKTAGIAEKEPDISGSGDFSALMKRLGITKKTEAPGVPPTPVSATPESPGDAVPPDTDFDDLLEDETLEEMPKKPADLARTDITEAKEKAAAEPVIPAPASKEPVVSPAREQQPRAAPIVEIVEEEPGMIKGSAAARRTKSIRRAEAPKETETDERIVSVDQLSDLSGLILPKGATFQVDELQLHGRINAFETTGTGRLPPELAEIWNREFASSGFKDLNLETDFGADHEKTKIAPAKKFGLASLFNAIRSEIEEYDPKVHGPLVDLSYTPKPGIEEMEMYPVNEPYAYVRVVYDHSTHEYTYHVLEPLLTDPEKDLVKELKERLFETLDINTKDISKEEARRQLRAAILDILMDYGLKLSPVQREKIMYNMHKDFLGEGLIDAIMHDKYIEDISCDGVNTPIFAFHSSYESMKTNLAYHTAEDLDSFVTKLAQRAGKYISIAEPILDATMQDGSRIQMTLGEEVTAHGSTFTIRKFKDEPITPTDLIEWHTFAPLSIAYIWLCVENGKSAIFAGGTASGKTTALNAISLFIPPMAKIVSLEDTREVKLPHPNWIPSVTRDSFDTAGRGEINMYELLRAAMRQRPEYIIVGEVRGKECQTLFQAMSTGHVTYSTTHADSVASVVHRIENPPMDVPRNMLSALDFICIQVQARVGGKRIRRNKQIVEILDIDPRTNELITNEVFKWRSATDEITYSGKSYLLEEIMEARGWNENRMKEELKRRQEVLEWMRIKKIRSYKDVAKILISYYREPEVVIERVRKDLYE